MNIKIHFEQDDDIIEICKDNVFKAVFTGKNKNSRIALSKFVSAMIGRNVKIIEIMSNEPPVNNIKDRQVRFDINCRAENGELIDVEMSYNPDPFEPVRLEFYTGKLFTGQGIKGRSKNYNDLKETYQITILAKESFFNDASFYHSFEYYDPINRISLNGKSRIITIELSKAGKVVNKPIKKMTNQEFWAVFFRYLTDKKKRDKINEIVKHEEGIAMASKVIMTISKDEHERARLLSEEKYILDTQSKLVHAKRQGIRQGIREGKREGKREGEQIGERKGKLEIVNLLKNGKTPEEIIQMFG